MSPKIKDPPAYESDDESIPPPPPPPPDDSSKEAFIDNHNDNENGVSTPAPSKKWRLLKKEAEHVLIPQDNLEDVAAASSASNGSPNPVQGYYRGVQNAQQDEEEEAGMDDIEIPSSSIVARLNGIERKLRRKKTLVRTGLIFLVLLVVIIAVTTGSIYGTRNKKSSPYTVSSKDPLLKTPASKYLSNKYPSITERTMISTLSPQYRALEWINDDAINGDFNYADETTFESEEKAFEFEQRYAAACFYYGLTEQEWVNDALWTSAEPVCNWHGIACIEDTVVRIELTDNLMRGILSPEISLMSGLQQILLDSNWIRGALPKDLSNLKELITLDLFDNLMTGTLPESFSTLSALNEMYLGRNQFSGTVPQLWKQLDNLQYLWLDDLSLSGNIPSILFEMQSLMVLKMSNSGLSGTIPTNAGDFATITYLNLSGNGITGGIPSSIQNLPLETLSVGDNPNLFDSDGGSFPDFLNEMTTLTELNLSNTGLSGEIPTFGSTDFQALTALDLSKNKLTGEIPLEIAFAENLALIALNENELEGALPWSFADLTDLEVLNLSNNKLTGTIPSLQNQQTSWAAATSFNSLKEIRLSNNYLEGQLPNFQGLDVIEEIHFDGNVFEGNIPQFISDLTTLVVLNLSNNNFEDSGGFTGTIPTTFATLDNLRVLNIEGNSISGTVPAAVAEMESLEEFYFFDNQISSVDEAVCSLNLGALMGGCSVSCSCCTDSCRL